MILPQPAGTNSQASSTRPTSASAFCAGESGAVSAFTAKPEWEGARVATEISFAGGGGWKSVPGELEHQDLGVLALGQGELRLALQPGGIAPGQLRAVDGQFAAHEVHVDRPRRVEGDGGAFL